MKNQNGLHLLHEVGITLTLTLELLKKSVNRVSVVSSSILGLKIGNHESFSS
jgi:hypothetical protein